MSAHEQKNGSRRNGDQPHAETPPPHDAAVERRLLGAILRDNNVYDEIASLVTAEDFFVTEHKAIFEALAKELTAADGIRATPGLIAARYFSGNGEGSGPFQTAMEAMVEEAASAATAADTARVIAALAYRRQTYTLCMKAAQEALDLSNDDYADTLLTGMEKRTTADFVITDMAELHERLLDGLNRMSMGETVEENGYKTGFKCLDNIMSPICPGNYVTLAAPTGQGKTSLGLQLAYNMAKQGAKVAYFTQEMSDDKLDRALISMVAGVDVADWRTERVTEKHVVACVRAVEEIKDLKIQILGQRPLSPDAIFSRTRTLMRKQGTDVVFIDYFGKLTMPGRFGNSQEEANRKSNRLQEIAGTLNLPLIILHQLNREVYKRTDKTPILTDLRDTGAIENDSDLVLFIQRSDFALSMSEPDSFDEDKHFAWRTKMREAQGRSTIWLAKDRQTGTRGNVTLQYNGIGQYHEPKIAGPAG